MSIYSSPPPLRPFSAEKPTLLVCWWITIFCTSIILLRVGGRYVRTERLFLEDKVAALAIVPLFLRMGAVHVILIYGTNNAQFAGANLTDVEIHQKSVASGLVILSRILYAATLWTFKVAILEFFKRLTGVSWNRHYEITIIFIRCTLGATFAAIVVSNLVECRPINHYWQVLPDPGGQCRQGYAQLITMATCNVITDLLLVFFPIPIILRSKMTIKRKAQLVCLFSLSLGVIAVTAYRVPLILRNHGRQQTRSLMASVEILFATAAANALVLGSFVRDRGVKKRKFKYGSATADSMERTSSAGTRRPTVQRHWGSDEDLVRDIGLGVAPDLRDEPDSPSTLSNAHKFRPAPHANVPEDMHLWRFPSHKRKIETARSDDSLLERDQLSTSQSGSTATPRKVSFFDVGGLLDDEAGSSTRRSSTRRDSHRSSVGNHSPTSMPSPTIPAGTSGLRRGSQALLQDLGGLLGPRSVSPRSRARNPHSTELQPIPSESHASSQQNIDNAGLEIRLMDPGGLLSPHR
ncbi:uncharacterized protein E0L32_011115 [Thyridium curvatum]|uniref:Rhodopsin domain-containing protein n=1 Tax=Thyridium curvatum TaxID=1093900 RepID=A0A507AS01_9PEZI|nr:uncharacterized protein E0L32_011115 [Thyridium curvatum]TPX06970.1 hypothetical protein E0L32_011115 [Thyridium curvatum]